MCKCKMKTIRLCSHVKTFFQIWCKNCNKSVKIDHACYIKRVDELYYETTLELNGFIFYDYENMLINGKHVANLIIAEKVCNSCLEGQICNSQCSMQNFQDNKSFCDWLFSQ